MLLVLYFPTSIEISKISFIQVFDTLFIYRLYSSNLLLYISVVANFILSAFKKTNYG